MISALWQCGQIPWWVSFGDELESDGLGELAMSHSRPRSRCRTIGPWGIWTLVHGPLGGLLKSRSAAGAVESAAHRPSSPGSSCEEEIMRREMRRRREALSLFSRPLRHDGEPRRSG